MDFGDEMSSTSTYFVRTCPACCRMVQIKLNYLGKQIRCVHCNREFTATDAHAESASLDDPVQYWLNYTTETESSVEPSSEFRRPR